MGLSRGDWLIATFTAIPRIGNSGTNGVLNGRGVSGCVFLIMIIPTHTITNANKVPMLVIFPTTLIGTNAAKHETKIISIRLHFHGVRNFGCTSRNAFGNSRSFAMEKSTRD